MRHSFFSSRIIYSLIWLKGEILCYGNSWDSTLPTLYTTQLSPQSRKNRMQTESEILIDLKSEWIVGMLLKINCKSSNVHLHRQRYFFDVAFSCQSIPYLFELYYIRLYGYHTRTWDHNRTNSAKDGYCAYLSFYAYFAGNFVYSYIQIAHIK